MSDTDKPPLMFPWINSPRVRRLEAWLWARPKSAFALTILSVALISSPAWFADFWSLFSNEAPVPKIMNWLSGFPAINFSWYWLPVGLGSVMLAVIGSLLWRGRKRLEAEVVNARAKVEPPKTIDVEQSAAAIAKEMERLQELAYTHSLSADGHEAALKSFKDQYALQIERADHQAKNITDYIELIRACTHNAKLDDDLPTIRWGFLIKNRSIFKVTLDGEVGSLFFEGRRLGQPKEIRENNLIGVPPDKDGTIVFEQQLSMPEAEMLRRKPKGKFQFDQTTIHFKGYEDERVVSRRLIILPEFQAELGRCTDAKTQAVAEVEAERDALLEKVKEREKKDDSPGAKMVASLKAEQIATVRNEGSLILEGLASNRVLVPYADQFETWKKRVVEILEPGSLLALRFQNSLLDYTYPKEASNATRGLADALYTKLMRLEEFIKELSSS